MKYPRFLFSAIILTFLFSIFSNISRSQSTDNIGNVDYRFEGSKLLVSYDIIKSNPDEVYEIWLEVTTASGEKIMPVTVFGDIKKGVVPGRKRTIIWDTHADDVVLGEGFTVKVLGEPVIRKETLPDSIVKKYEFPHTNDLGIGLGMDYGGILGVKMTFSPVKYLGIFACAGLQFEGLGWEFGVKGYIIPKTSKKGFRPYLKGMYGINASIYIMDYDIYNKLYPGLSIGPGMEFRFGRMKKHGFDIDVNFPMYTDEFEKDMDRVRNDPNVEIESEPSIVTISIGYHMEF
jgi:hypothetical protein